MKDKETILKEIQEVLTSKLNVHIDNDITLETSLLKDGLGLDSVMLLELIIELELLFEIELDEDELNVEYFGCLDKIIELIQSKMEKRND